MGRKNSKFYNNKIVVFKYKRMEVKYKLKGYEIQRKTKESKNVNSYYLIK